ncbi:MAG: ribose-5-phosphate isomerase RpiA [Gammaproteobacteria bacterium]|jgi:ribose 5-phosphate isomerase A|nr:ribose 5-phosphate isomerase A [Chromatiales bacterium]MDP6674105.1 ribose-5-phosphate isomerase RpiA [Gammaproteobacteria bacterium]
MHHGEKKQQAAKAALQCIKPGTILGVGTGSTVNYFIDELPAFRDQLEAIVVSSKASEDRLKELGFTITPLNEAGSLDLYVDGADEANKQFHLIKGGGGALTREKILAAAAREFVCIIDDSKWVGVLGTFPLPVEVIPMARSYIARQFVKNRGQPILRQDFITDNGNEVLDIYNLQITNPVEMENRFNQIPGIVTVGIFAQRPADRIFMATEDGVKEKMRG